MENYVYWFTEVFTEYDILINIYILLFIYCISSLIIKFLTIVKNTNNIKNRR